jgi:enoyl-CoA hydratase/carnithine racemase
MAWETLKLATGDGIAILTLARPPVNALGRRLVEELRDAAAALEKDGSLRAVIVAAEGKTFCAGADLKERQTMTEDDVRSWVPFMSGTFTRIAALPMPTIAAIQGTAAGGGFELALACDIRVAERSAKLGLRETALAILPGAGGTQRLTRLVGPSRAKRWIFTARMHPAEEAMADGAVDAVVEDGAAIAAARSLAAEIAVNGPVAVRAAKRAIDEGLGLASAAALEVERRAYESIIPTEDRREALKAFAEKRNPVFRGR